MDLDQLPTEIIQRIATFLPCQHAISLMKTNRRCHNAIKDRLVFKGMIAPTTLLYMKALPPFPTDSTAYDYNNWARLTLADQKLYKLIDEFSPEIKPEDIKRNHESRILEYNTSTAKLMSAIPQLVASHHPVTRPLDPISLIAPFVHFYPSPAPPELLHALDFCLSVKVLHSIETIFKSGWFPLDKIEEIVRLLTDYSILDRPKGGWVPCTIFMCKLMPFIHSKHNSALSPLKINPPSGFNIPYPSFMALPQLFSPAALQDFQTCHKSTMATPEFLLDGKWASYYSLSTTFSDNPLLNFQPPVTDVQFLLATPEAFPDLANLTLPAGSTALTATGDDSFGLFAAQGLLGEDGKVRMIETNYRGQQWLWDLKVCPFGLFGTWGTTDEVNGYLWMFKEDWAFKAERGVEVVN